MSVHKKPRLPFQASVRRSSFLSQCFDTGSGNTIMVLAQGLIPSFTSIISETTLLDPSTCEIRDSDKGHLLPRDSSGHPRKDDLVAMICGECTHGSGEVLVLQTVFPMESGVGKI